MEWQEAHGHPEMLYFHRGYLCALHCNKIITKKEFNKLWKVYGFDNDDCLFYIDKNGEIAKHED